LLRCFVRTDLFLVQRQVSQESFDDVRVELLACVVVQELAGLIATHRLAVLAVFANRIKAINNGEYASRHPNLFAFERIRITATVPSLVMVSDDGNDRIGEVHSLQNLRTYDRVDFHLLELGGGELARLIQDVVWNRDLAHIMEQRAGFERFNLKLIQTE